MVSSHLNKNEKAVVLMEMVIHLNNQMKFNVTMPGFNTKEFAKSVSNPALQMITIGDVVLNKFAITVIAPKVERENAGIMLYLNNGDVFTTSDVEYSPEDFAIQLNNPQSQLVALGDIVVNKPAVMMVVPIQAIPVES